ncbi:MAG: winged helix-turn-helix transcriptional regulator [bacterium]
MNIEKNEIYKSSSDFITLRMLEEIHQNQGVSQRDLSKNLGVALGFTNACIKNLVKRGAIKLKKAKGKKLLYLITPLGLKEKAKLSYRALMETTSFYAKAKDSISGFFEALGDENIRRILFYGVDDLLDIILIVLRDFPIEVVCIIDDDGKTYRTRDFPVLTFQEWEDAVEKRPDFQVDAVVISSLKHLDSAKKRFKKHEDKIKIRNVFDIYWGGRTSG